MIIDHCQTVGLHLAFRAILIVGNELDGACFVFRRTSHRQQYR